MHSLTYLRIPFNILYSQFTLSIVLFFSYTRLMSKIFSIVLNFLSSTKKVLCTNVIGLTSHSQYSTYYLYMKWNKKQNYILTLIYRIYFLPCFPNIHIENATWNYVSFTFVPIWWESFQETIKVTRRRNLWASFFC